MKTNSQPIFLHIALVYFCLFLHANKQCVAQNVTMTIKNMVQTAPNSFEYDVMLVKTGTPVVNLRQYQWTINYTPGLPNGGTLTHQFLSRHTAFNTLPGVSASVNAFYNYIRGVTATVSICCGPSLSNGIEYKLARMKVQTSVASFPTNFNPFLPPSPIEPLQLTTDVNRPRSKLSTLINPPNSFFDIIGFSNTPTTNEKNWLYGYFVPSPTGSSPFLLNTCTNTNTSTTISSCNSYFWPSSGFTYTTSGVYTVTTLIGSGPCIHTNTLHLTIHSNSSNTSTVTACNSYFWPISGLTYTSSGIYSHTALLGSTGCVHTSILQLTVFTTTHTTSMITACDTYVWSVTGITYTTSGTYTAYVLNTTGCVDTSILQLSLSNIQVNSTNTTLCAGLSTTLIAGGGSNYVWQPGNLTGSSVTVSPTATTTYTVTGTVSALCLSTRTITITVIPTTSPPFVTASANPICNGSSTSLSASGSGSNYLWQPGGIIGNSILVSPISTTTYTVEPIVSSICPGKATYTVHVNPCSQTDLHVTCFIEAYMIGSGLMINAMANSGIPAAPDDCDSIVVELRHPLPPYGIYQQAKGILKNYGLAMLSFPALNGWYYIVVKHRNALETWSSAPVFLSGLFGSYDFSLASTQAFGANQSMIAPGLWAFYSGDVVKDPSESTDLADISKVQVDINTYAFGYEVSDITGDGNVDLLDMPLLENNVNSFVFVHHP